MDETVVSTPVNSQSVVMEVVSKFVEVPTDSLFVCDLSILHTESILRQIFKRFGTVLTVDHKLWSRGSKLLTGFCFIRFQNVAEATRAKKAMNRKVSFGRILR